MTQRHILPRASILTCAGFLCIVHSLIISLLGILCAGLLGRQGQFLGSVSQRFTGLAPCSHVLSLVDVEKSVDRKLFCCLHPASGLPFSCVACLRPKAQSLWRPKAAIFVCPLHGNEELWKWLWELEPPAVVGSDLSPRSSEQPLGEGNCGLQQAMVCKGAAAHPDLLPGIVPALPCAHNAGGRETDPLLRAVQTGRYQLRPPPPHPESFHMEW